MKKSLSISLFVLLAISIFTFSGRAQSSDPPPPYPCKPCTASIDGDRAATVVPDDTVIVSSFNTSIDSTGGTESFYDDVNDSLVTDGKDYFRKVLGIPEPKASSDIY